MFTLNVWYFNQNIELAVLNFDISDTYRYKNTPAIIIVKYIFLLRIDNYAIILCLIELPWEEK